MHPELSALFKRLTQLREAAGHTAVEVEESLVIGPGWINEFESGSREPSFGTLAAMLNMYGERMDTFFAGLDFGDDVILDRHLAAEAADADLVLHFPMGSYKAQVTIAGATVDEFNSVLLVLRDGLAHGAPREAVADSFLHAARIWPHANPSDLWYFLVSHAYQDELNHPAHSAGRDLSQSWKRTSGWSLEAIFVNHYNPHLTPLGLRLDMPAPEQKRAYLAEMGLTTEADAEKSDILVLGTDTAGHEHPFGVIHVKASFAERRTDDAPLSMKLMRSNYVSSLLTMDCKATPSAKPVNRGELGPAQGGTDRVSSKRLDIERDRIFDAAFVYNTNTNPTPQGSNVAARIAVCDFANADDVFSAHLVRRWKERQGP